MSILISCIIVILADLFSLSFFINFPITRDINGVVDAIKNPCNYGV